MTALPFELVHASVEFTGCATGGRRNRFKARNVGGKSKLRQRVTRMGASREATIAFA